MKTKKNMISLITVTMILGSLLISRPAYAAENGFWGSTFFSGFINFISKEFNLDKTKVQSAVQSYKEQKKATITPRPTKSPLDRQAAERERLDVLVTQGKITGDQETAILLKLEEMRTKYVLDPNATAEQRKAQMEAIQSDLKAWAQAQGLDESVMAIFGRGGGFGGGRMGGGFKGNREPRPTANP